MTLLATLSYANPTAMLQPFCGNTTAVDHELKILLKACFQVLY